MQTQKQLYTIKKQTKGYTHYTEQGTSVDIEF